MSVVLATAPTVESVTITPSPAHYYDNLTSVCVGNDTENDSLVNDYLWYVDGVETDFTTIDFLGQGISTHGSAIYGDGTYIYLADAADGIRAYSVSDGALTLEDTSDEGGIYKDIWGDGTYIYAAANGDGGLKAYTFNGTSLTYKGVIAVSSTVGIDAWGVYADEDYVYLANYNDGIRAYTFDGSSFSEKGHIDPGNSCKAVWGDGTYIYLLCGDDGMFAYTFNGATFTLKDSIDTGGEYRNIGGVGNTTFYVTKYYAGLFAYSFNGTDLIEEGSIDDGSDGYVAVWTDGIKQYVANMRGGLRIYNFNGTGFTYEASINDTSGQEYPDIWQGVWNDGTNIYTSTWVDDIQIYTYDSNVVNSSNVSISDQFISSCRVYDGNEFSAWTNSSTSTILGDDSCTYSGTGNWDINISDNCTINESLSNGNLTISGVSGSLTINGSITADKISIEPSDFNGDFIINILPGKTLGVVI